MKRRKKRQKNRKTWPREWLKNRTSFGAYYTLLAELRNHVFLSRVGLSTHINTFSKFHSNRAAVSVALLDLSTKPRDTKLEGDCCTSFNKRQLVERNRLKLYSVQQPSTAVQQVEWHISTINLTIHDTLFNISWVHLLLNNCWTVYHWLKTDMEILAEYTFIGFALLCFQTVTSCPLRGLFSIGWETKQLSCFPFKFALFNNHNNNKNNNISSFTKFSRLYNLRSRN